MVVWTLPALVTLPLERNTTEDGQFMKLLINKNKKTHFFLVWTEGEGLEKYVMVKKKSYVEKGERIKIVDENSKMGNSVMWK